MNRRVHDDHLLLSSVLFSLIAPFIGLLVAVVLFARREVGAGWATLAASCASGVVWLAVLVAA